jgi:hypothetical protein
VDRSFEAAARTDVIGLPVQFDSASDSSLALDASEDRSPPLLKEVGNRRTASGKRTVTGIAAPALRKRTRRGLGVT